MRLLLLVVMAASCVSSETQLCRDGTTCPAGFTCGTAGGCFSPEEIEACIGVADSAECQTPEGRGFCRGNGCATVVCGNGIEEQGEACDDGNTRSADGCSGTCTSDESCGNNIIELDEQCDPPGLMCSAECATVRCGNNVIDPGEVCDDGNIEPLDGCYADCLSNETCGNGIVDFRKGEQCDDNNAVAFDGCGECLIEAFDWRETVQTAPSGRGHAATAYDVARGRIVMFGGTPNFTSVFDETWESNGRMWTRRYPLRSPPRRMGAMMTYDSTRQRVILFGGGVGQTFYNDTWEYDGITWTRIDAPVKPPPRMWGVLAYDPVRARVVLHGGFTGAYLGDTWEFDGSTWMQRVLTPNPGPLADAAAVFDPKRGVVVLYGGRPSATTDTAALWDLDANGWTAHGNGNVARWGHGLVYDAVAGKVVAVAGVVGGALQNDIVDFDGVSTWTPRSTTGTPPTARFRSSVAYDIEHDRLVIFGGGDLSQSFFFNDGASVSPTNAWEADAAPPGQLQYASLYDDLRRGRVRAFGGEVNGSNVTNATLELDGDGWRVVSDPPDADPAFPVPRRQHGIAYDSARGVAVMYGGRGSGPNVIPADTWELDGTTWTKDTGAQPPERFNHAMAYDSRRAVVVMFGGVANAVTKDDTWEYDGNWTLRTPATKPPADAGHAMTYDPARGVTVLVTTTGETWEWNGTTWTEITTPVSAQPRRLAGIAYHVDRRTVVLTAGLPTTANGGGLSDTWEYDGTTWTPLSSALLPTDRFSLGMTYSAARHAVVVAGGTTASLVLDTWELGYQPGRGPEVCTGTFDYDNDGAAGCADIECWPVCAPTCPIGAPLAQCQTTPRCGDGVCSPVENCRTCTADCACPAAICGDGYCESPENATDCPGDC